MTNGWRRTHAGHNPAWDGIVDVSIKKVCESKEGERFVLVNTATRKILTVHDTSEGALRRFFTKRGVTNTSIDHCLERARQRYAERTEAQPSVDHAADTSEDDLLASLGLDDEL